MTDDDKDDARRRASDCLRRAADEPDLPDWLRQVLQLAAADPKSLEMPEAEESDPFNFIYFH
ncbi:hypothetical protein [Magnetospirillum sp. SS-4]|uniref:hypothetical protein n=1 Tax=Magnetospirillum sp. SS-4 TaxID=2681465 RepID=UPI0013842CE9|nr:hypothetical protein [Magnetospirillum sp. SS-4]CAA7616859.1 hypothetical protein MTBSS4_170019 [Magnetospirillum sp. SS-4]